MVDVIDSEPALNQCQRHVSCKPSFTVTSCFRGWAAAGVEPYKPSPTS